MASKLVAVTIDFYGSENTLQGVKPSYCAMRMVFPNSEKQTFVVHLDTNEIRQLLSF